jgi:tricorn protease-like protein
LVIPTISGTIKEVDMHCTNCGKENEEGNQFCMYCGTELYKPDAASSEPEIRESTPAVSQKVDTPPEEEKRTSLPRDRRKIFIILGAAGAFLVLLVCIWAGVAFWGFQIFSPGEQLVYGIQEDLQDNITVIMSVNENGKDNKEIYSDNDGFRSFAIALDYYPWRVNSVFSPDGNTIAVAENNGDLLLLDRDTTVPVSVDIQNKSGLVGLGYLQGFSPNGKYFGFTDLDGNTLVTMILDLQGNEIYSVEDRALGTFLPDNRHVVVFETDRENVSGLGILDFLSGEYTYLTSLEETDTTYTIWYSVASPVLVSPNGNTLYYVDGTNLMSIPTNGSSSSLVYESDEGINFMFFSPDERTMAIVDRDGNNLYLYDTRRDERSRVTNDVENIAFSPNGRYLAYVTNEGSSERDLYVSRSDGSDKVRIVRNANWLKFAFSPDNNYIAYIDGSSSQDGGSLYVVRRDGSDSIRLDTGVWSFRFVDNGRSIVYIKVNDLDRGNPESELYRIRINGRNKERILQADDGLFTFIWPVP